MNHGRAASVLGVQAGATVEEITAAYRHLAADHHPDRGGSTVRMQEINAARDTLLAPPDPIARVTLRPPREANCYSDYSNLHRRCV
jgi:hypothetical protein